MTDGRNPEKTYAIQVVNERNMTLVPPFDDPMVIGARTAGLEIVQDLNI